MRKKNRYHYLCLLKVHQLKLEFGHEIEVMFKHVIMSSYNSMIDSQSMDILDSGRDTPLIVKEHSVKVDEVNQLFKELSNKVNDQLSHKFPNDMLETFSNLQFTI